MAWVAPPMYAKIAPTVAMTAVNIAIWLIIPPCAVAMGRMLRRVLQLVVVRAVNVEIRSGHINLLVVCSGR